MICERLRSTGLASLLGPSNPINADLYTFLPVVNTDTFFSRFACLRANVLDQPVVLRMKMISDATIFLQGFSAVIQHITFISKILTTETILSH